MSGTQPLQLIYFDGRGLGELCRLTLVACHLPFSDIRITDEEETEKMKHLKPTLPFGQLPVLILENGKTTIAQSNAIVRYLARKHGLHGKSPEEESGVDTILDSVVDVRRKRDPLRYFDDVAPELKGKHVEKYWNEEHEIWAGHFERWLVRNRESYGGSHWLVGSAFTVADLSVFNWFSTYFDEKPELFKHHPLLSALIKSVRDRPEISAYLARRPPKASWDF